MAVYFKTGLSGKPAFQFTQVAIGKINNLAAVGTNQMVVMFGRSAYQVAPAISPGVHFADETKFRKRFQSAVNRHQPDAGVLTAYPLVYGRWSQVLSTFNNAFDDSSPLRSNFITVLSQRAFNLLF
jgi:hypothetical protein